MSEKYDASAASSIAHSPARQAVASAGEDGDGVDEGAPDAEALAVGETAADAVLPLGLGEAPSGAHAVRLTARAAANTAVTAGRIGRRIMWSRVRGTRPPAGTSVRALRIATRLSA